VRLHRLRGGQGSHQSRALRVGRFREAASSPRIAFAGQQDRIESRGFAKRIAALEQPYDGSRVEFAAAVNVAVLARHHVGQLTALDRHPQAFADTADARDNKTGTVMGAPVDPGVTRPKTSTVAGAPLAGSDRPPPMASNVPTPYEPTRPPTKRGGSGLIIGLAAIATLLGAGAVVTYVMSTGTGSSSGGTPTVLVTTTPPPTTPVTNTTTTAVTPPTSTTATPLKPPPPSVDPTPPKPQPKPDAGGGSVQPQPDAGGFPGSSGGTTTVDAGTSPAPSQTTYVTPFGTIVYPGPKPPFWPPDQPWPPPWIPQQPQ